MKINYDFKSIMGIYKVPAKETYALLATDRIYTYDKGEIHETNFNTIGTIEDFEIKPFPFNPFEDTKILLIINYVCFGFNITKKQFIKSNSLIDQVNSFKNPERIKIIRNQFFLMHDDYRISSIDGTIKFDFWNIFEKLNREGWGIWDYWIDENFDLWLLTNAGIFYMEHESQQFETILSTDTPEKTYSFIGNMPFVIMKNRLWFAEFYGTLFCYNTKTRNFEFNLNLNSIHYKNEFKLHLNNIFQNNFSKTTALFTNGYTNVKYFAELIGSGINSYYKLIPNVKSVFFTNDDRAIIQFNDNTIDIMSKEEDLYIKVNSIKT